MSDQYKISLPDGSVREMPAGSTPADVAAAIGPGLAKAALAARIDGELVDLTLPFSGDASLALVTARDEADALDLARHDFAHVLAEAVQALFPGTQITFGPSTDDGFYYDFAPKDRAFTDEDLPAIEAQMRKIIAANKPLRREEWSREQLISRWKQQGESFKAEWAAELPGDEPLTVYWSGDDWLDMCRGPHLPSTGKLDPNAFKLTRVSGAYWRGDQNNAQLQRIYGTCWASDADLAAYVKRIEEAEKRDHRKIGQSMDLFHIQEEAKGMIFWHPKGWTVYRLLLDYMRRRIGATGYVEVKTPQIADKSLWERSGHWEKFQDSMFIAETEEGETLCVKPMNCPLHIQIFNHGQRSYRDLPIRMAEFEGLHRCESSGSTHGLLRVRQLAQDDAHIFCTEDQIVEESRDFVTLLNSVYADLGVELHSVKLALRPDKRFGTDEQWTIAEDKLEQAANAAGVQVERIANEGAFYGPKLEFHLRDAIGRTWQCGTLQLDYVLPERLGAEYVGADGNKHRPVMLHRAIFGSLERFIGVLIEHYAGAFPLWLSPTQIVVAAITSDADGYAQEVTDTLKAAGLRVECDLRNEKIGYKVREHSLAKVPLILVVGKKEAEERTVALRRLGVENERQIPMSLADAVTQLTAEATPPDLARLRR